MATIGSFNALNGLFLFLRNKYVEKISYQKHGCQRPKRAFLISTVLSQEPHKHWLCRLFFACNYLNILKQTVLRPFSGMFTVRSYFSLSLGVFFTDINYIYLSFMQIHDYFYFNYIIYSDLLIFCCQNVAMLFM